MALTDKLTEIGNAIREKTNSSELIPLADMPQAILDISGGGGKAEQKKTVTITENGTIEILPDNNKTLSKVTVVTDVEGITPLDNTVTFTVDGEPYEIVSVKNGNSVNAPAIEPIKEGTKFSGWKNNETIAVFPFTPTEDIELVAYQEAYPGGYVLYMPLEENITAKTEQELTITGTDYSFQKVDNVPCIKMNSTVISLYESALAGKNFTISFWGKLLSNPNGNGDFFWIRDKENEKYQIAISVERNKLEWFFWDTATGAAKYSGISPYIWHHIVLTYENSVLTLYIDGAYKTRETNTSQNFISDSIQLEIGSNINDYMTAIRVYNRALTQEEITLLSKEFSPTDR